MPKEAKEGECLLCERHGELTFHHLIPKTLHKKKWYQKNYTDEQLQSGIDICYDCHTAIHEFISEKELGKTYNTREKLLEHSKVAGFVQWVSKRNGNKKSVRSNERRRMQ